jgi:hypothetical protein
MRLYDPRTTRIPAPSSLDPHIHIRRLYVCLSAIWCYAKPCNGSDLMKGKPLPRYFRTVFSDHEDEDTRVPFTSFRYFTSVKK